MEAVPSKSPRSLDFGGSSSFSDASFAGEFPKDLNSARCIIENLIEQVMLNDDVTSNLELVHKRLLHIRSRTKEHLSAIEKSLKGVEKVWEEQLKELQSEWTTEYNRLHKVIDSASTSEPFTFPNSIKPTRKHLESFFARMGNVEKGVEEIREISEATLKIEGKMKRDRLYIQEIDTKLAGLAAAERKLNTELSRQINAQLQGPLSQRGANFAHGNYYGISEIEDAYEKAIRNLDAMLKCFEEIVVSPNMQSISHWCSVDKRAAEKDIEAIRIVAKSLLAKLQAQNPSKIITKEGAEKTNISTVQSAASTSEYTSTYLYTTTSSSTQNALNNGVKSTTDLPSNHTSTSLLFTHNTTPQSQISSEK